MRLCDHFADRLGPAHHFVIGAARRGDFARAVALDAMILKIRAICSCK